MKSCLKRLKKYIGVLDAGKDAMSCKKEDSVHEWCTNNVSTADVIYLNILMIKRYSLQSGWILYNHIICSWNYIYSIKFFNRLLRTHQKRECLSLQSQPQ